VYTVIFYILAAISVFSAIMVVTVRNIAYAAFGLLFTFFGVAGLYVMLGADFVGVSQLLIYVGGILVLFLFGMMLTTNIDRLGEDRTPAVKPSIAFIVAVAIGTLLVTVVLGVPQWKNAKPNPQTATAGTTSLIGTLFMGDYALLFIASAIAILVALVGAAMIARTDKLSPGEAAERM
jgi:NADH-quinone oxidoreductase subunit J